MPITTENMQSQDPRWMALQEEHRRAERREKLEPLKLTRGKKGSPPLEATRLTVAQAHAYHTSAMKDFELAVRSGKEADILMRRLEVEAAVKDLVEAARFEQVILDLRATMRSIETRGPKVAPAAPPAQHEPGG